MGFPKHHLCIDHFWQMCQFFPRIYTMVELYFRTRGYKLDTIIYDGFSYSRTLLSSPYRARSPLVGTSRRYQRWYVLVRLGLRRRLPDVGHLGQRINESDL